MSTNLLNSVGESVRQFICGLHGHDALLHFEDGRMSLLCSSCGHETPGWDVTMSLQRRLEAAERQVRQARLGARVAVFLVIASCSAQAQTTIVGRGTTITVTRAAPLPSPAQALAILQRAIPPATFPVTGDGPRVFVLHSTPGVGPFGPFPVLTRTPAPPPVLRFRIPRQHSRR